MNMDRSFFIVMEEFSDGELLFTEQKAITSRDIVLREIATGQAEQPYKVFEFNPIEGWSRDITEDIARDCLKAIIERGNWSYDVNDLPSFLIENIDDIDAIIAEERAAG